MSFYEGAVSYDYLRNLAIPELIVLQENAERINARRSKK